MDNDDDQKPHGLGLDWAHLLLRDTRTPEERQAAEMADRARRRGRGRKDWWKKYLPADGQAAND